MALHMYERVVNLISKEPAERKVSDIESLLQWFLNKSNLLKSLQKDVVVDIIKNCEFRKTPEDTVIIRQGDRGDSFYINLSGSVSVYINAQLEDLEVARKKTAKGRKKSDEKGRRISADLKVRRRSEVAEKQRRISHERNRRTSRESGGAASRKTSAEVKQPDTVKERVEPKGPVESEKPERSKTPVKKAVVPSSSSSNEEDDDGVEEEEDEDDDDDDEDDGEAPAELKSNLPKEKKRDDKRLDRTPFGQHIVQLS